MHEKPDSQTRKSKRIRISNLSRVDNQEANIINASREGLLISTTEDVSRKQVRIQLKIDGKWVDLEARVVWSFSTPGIEAMSMGVYINNAPQEYTDLIDNLYLETEEF